MTSTTGLRHGRIAGLTMASELALPDVHAWDGLDEPAQLQLRLAPVPARLDDAWLRGATWEVCDDRVLLNLPGICRLLVGNDGVLALDATDPADALPLVLGPAVAIALLQRKRLVLRASAVAHRGRAYLFCGPGGMGKSTLAAALCMAGAEFICDDLCAITLDDAGRPVLWADGRHLELLEDAIAHLGLAPRRRNAVRAGTAKFHVEPTGLALAGPLPIAAIHMLRDARGGRSPGTALETLPPVAAAQSLQLHGYHPRLALALKPSEQTLRTTAALVRSARIGGLTLRRDLSALAATAADLLKGWSRRDV